MKRAAAPASVLAVAMVLAAPAARAQVQVAPGTVTQLSADASVGYVASTAQGGLNNINFGLSADLNGYYYHPNFLQFEFSPYYNQGREYSAADFISGDKGFSTALHLFSGGNIPFYLQYSRSFTHSGLFGVVGSEASVVGEGSNENLNLNWSVRLRRLPSLQLGYVRSSGDYRVFGDNASFGKARTSGYVFAMQHSVLGFALGASYTGQRFQQTLPRVLVAGEQKPITKTDQKNLQFTVSRRLWKTSFFDLAASRVLWNTDATSQPQNRRYNTLSTGLTARPVERLATGFRVNYTSDLSAQLLGSVLPGSLGSSGTDSNGLLLNSSALRTRYATYTAYASYDVNHSLSVRSSLRHGSGRFTGRPGSRDISWDNALTFRHSFHGARLTSGYTAGVYDFANGASRTSSQGHTGTVGLAKLWRGWDYSGVFQYSTSDIDALLPGNARNLSTELSVAGYLKDWRLVGSLRYERADTIFNTETENRRKALRVALSRSRFSLASQFQFSSGLSILAVAGPRTASIAQAVAAGDEFERLLIPSESRAFTLSGSYQLARRTTLNGGWSRLHYRTFQNGRTRENQLDQVDVHFRHWFRQLDIRTGYRRYHQEFSGLSGLYNANTFYFQVSRHFDVF